MRESLLGHLYFSLSTSDRQRFHQALRSGAFELRPEVIRLFDFMARFAEGPGTGKQTARRKAIPVLDKRTAFAYIFFEKEGGRSARPAFNDGKMRHLMSYALEAMRRYLAWDDWQKDSAQVGLHLIRALKKRGFETRFDREHARILANLEAEPFRSADYFYHRYALELEAWEHFRATQRNREGNLQGVGEAFGAYVAINTLRQGCAALAQKTLAALESPMPYLAETLALVEKGAFNGNAAVETYYFSYKALTEPDNDEVFQALKLNMEQYGARFPDAELRDLYILAINFCIRRLNSGERRYIDEAFGLYRAGLARKVFLENGYLSRFTYRNILNLALALGEWDWALEYLHGFAPFLAPKERENVFRYNLATYYFRRPEYDQALELLRHVEFRDMLYNFDARRMLLRIYYARKEWQALDSLLDSFTVYLQRHRDAGYHREMYRNLVRFTRRMINLKPGDAAGQQRLQASIERTVHVAEREWLLGTLKKTD